MTSAPEIIKKLLNDLNIPNDIGSEDESIVFNLDDACRIEVYKHPYSSGYGIHTKCDVDGEIANSKASFVDSMQLQVTKNRLKMFGTSAQRALNAGEIYVSTKLTNKPSDYEDGTFYIKCDDFGECSVKKHASKHY